MQGVRKQGGLRVVGARVTYPYGAPQFSSKKSGVFESLCTRLCQLVVVSPSPTLALLLGAAKGKARKTHRPAYA